MRSGATSVVDWLDRNGAELVRVRRQIHAQPELGREEFATTDLLCDLLSSKGIAVQRLPGGSGLFCDIGAGPVEGRAAAGADIPTVLLRADIDALPLQDEKSVSYRSTIPGVAHACGHDVHTVIALGATLALADVHKHTPLPGRVRTVFQPAEELMPGGALDVIEAGVLNGVACAFALHCDPGLDVGKVGIRSGAITAAADRVELTVRGPGGHTSRPQNTVDLVFVLGRLLTELPAALSRLVDPRSAMVLVWGQVNAGTVPNAIPRSGTAAGTLRTLDRAAWQEAPELVTRLAQQIGAPYGAEVQVNYRRGVPPVVNGTHASGLLAAATTGELGAEAAVPTPQSLGGEDFAWYLEQVPGAMARLGTRSPGGETFDLHQGRFDVDERAIGVGVQVMTGAARRGLESLQDAHRH